MMKQLGIFNEEDRLKKLSKLGDPLERLDVIDWTVFRPVLERALQKKRKSNAGRPAYDYLMMFKILVLQRLYNISDDGTEYQINDRLSFMRFLDLTLGDKVPDAKTVWVFREALTRAEAEGELFELFNRQMEAQGIITHTGTIVDATFVDAPRQRNTREENKSIKRGKYPRNGRRMTLKLNISVRKRIQMPAGQRKGTRHITGTRITRKLTRTARSSQITGLPPPAYMTARNSVIL